MKIKKKFALLIDCFLIVSIVVGAMFLFGNFNFRIFKTESGRVIISLADALCFLVYSFVVFILLTLLFSMKDLTFKNASIGMKIMGFMILDKNFNVPSKKTLIKRNLRFFAQRDIEYAIYRNKEMFSLKWEYNRFGTVTVDKKRFLRDKDNYIREIQNDLKSDIRY